MSMRRTAPGFSLIELMITLAIAAVLVMVAIPNYQSFVAGERAKSAAQNLFFAMQLARSEAIKRNAQVAVTEAGNSWAAGWNVAQAATSIRTQQPLSGVTISSGGVTNVTYDSDGRVSGGGMPSFTVCDTANLSKQQILTVYPSGVPELSQGGACP